MNKSCSRSRSRSRSRSHSRRRQSSDSAEKIIEVATEKFLFLSNRRDIFLSSRNCSSCKEHELYKQKELEVQGDENKNIVCSACGKLESIELKGTLPNATQHDDSISCLDMMKIFNCETINVCITCTQYQDHCLTKSCCKEVPTRGRRFRCIAWDDQLRTSNKKGKRAAYQSNLKSVLSALIMNNESKLINQICFLLGKLIYK